MTWATAIQYAKDFLTVIALLGALWSALVFVRKIAADREAARKASVAAWLKVEIHKVLATSEQMLTVDELVTSLRKASFVTPIEFSKEELSEANVRLQLLSMVENGILGQRWPERFGITQLPYDPMSEITTTAIKMNKVARQAFALIQKYPEQYDDARLWKDLGHESELSEADFLLAVSDLRTKGIARQIANGRWTATAATTGGLS